MLSGERELNLDGARAVLRQRERLMGISKRDRGAEKWPDVDLAAPHELDGEWELAFAEKGQAAAIKTTKATPCLTLMGPRPDKS